MQSGSNNSDGASPSFFLTPLNSAAKNVISIEHNAPYIKVKNGHKALHIAFLDLQTGSAKNLIMLGRDPNQCDIVIPESTAGIHRQHCYFQYNQTTGAVVLSDRSANLATAVYDDEEDCIVPISKNFTSVVITRGFNRNLHFGKKAHYKFQVVWENGTDRVKSFLSTYPNHFGPQRTNFDPSKARYLQGEVLGHGGFGIVWKAINIRDGTPMAVKRFHSLEGKGHVMAMREINNMLTVSSNNRKKHDYILSVLSVEYDTDDYKWIEVFMPLMEGSAKLLIESGMSPLSDADIGNVVLCQMAEALKYMAKYEIVHRDVKPENILYQTEYNEAGEIFYHFRLADFGLSNESASARTRAGTPMFMAPEVYNRQPQTPKTDVWSLFVTVAWIYNVEEFRDFSADVPDELLKKILEMAENEIFANIKDMAVPDPRFRVSAKSLVSRLKGNGTQSVNDVNRMARAMAGVDLGGTDEPIVPSISEGVMNSFQSVHGGSSRRRQPAAMDGMSAIQEFYNTDAGVSMSKQHPAAAKGSDYRRPRRGPGDSQEYDGADDVNIDDRDGDEYLASEYLYYQ